jgi:hypothetical protein
MLSPAVQGKVVFLGISEPHSNFTKLRFIYQKDSHEPTNPAISVLQQLLALYWNSF